MLIQVCFTAAPMVLCVLYIPLLRNLLCYFFPIFSFNQIVFGIFTCGAFRLELDQEKTEKLDDSAPAHELQPLDIESRHAGNNEVASASTPLTTTEFQLVSLSSSSHSDPSVLSTNGR